MKDTFLASPSTTGDINQLYNEFIASHLQLLQPITKLHRMYFPLFHDETYCWILIVVDVPLRKIFVLDPGQGNIQFNDSYLQKIDLLRDYMKSFMAYCHLLDDNNNDNAAAGQPQPHNITPYTVERYRFQFHSPIIRNHCNMGMAVLMYIYFFIRDCPVWFKEDYMLTLRHNFAYWISTPNLPI